ncbi:LuxR C-terminal-related transcriptional regulator [Streptomyces sp. P38-E01]|uniref:LuxR C-terminal-related transcriptional regulator n=1 Tax=Streptomyces tardus TaxID=2780544 RepID=A0A949JCV0_9ACTN|nr:LuxR C-terminal-related transcriptional regulator [Streptomyces tardus]MBU7597102.1 LuxR C-terminal-related transcriptional regulator [Streptomyces tardus]
MSTLAPPPMTVAPTVAPSTAAVLPSVRLVPPRPDREAVRVRTLLRRAGLHCESGPEPARRATGTGLRAAASTTCTAPATGVRSGTVTVLVADDAERELRRLTDVGPLLLICDTVTRTSLRQALRVGAVVLRNADLTAEGLRDAVRRAGNLLPSIPYPMLSHLLTREGRPARTDRTQQSEKAPWGGVRPTLTARQVLVLRLMAEGHGNADIAELLSCSEHTVKNIIYEVMSRLQARNRAHAVARALRDGLI